MAIEVRSTGTATTTSDTVTIQAEAGDLSVIIVASQYGTTNATPPSGWDATVTSGAAGFARSGYVATKRWDAAGSETVTPLAGTEDDAARLRAVVVTLQGVDDYVVSGWQTAQHKFTRCQELLATQAHGAAGTTTWEWDADVTCGEVSGAASWSLLQVGVIGEALTPTTAPAGFARVLLADGTEPESNNTVDDTTRRSTTTSTGPAVTRVVPAGAANTATLMSGSSPAFIAHRGSSTNWAEMSASAYTNSVVHGTPALELSAHCTVDGVWVLCHDVTLQSIDSAAPATDIREMKWLEVRQYETRGAPITRLDEVVAAYKDSHVLFLDPKNSALRWREMVDALDLDQSRVVLKFSGDANWLAAQWKASGWTTWGYFYERNIVDGALEFTTDNWDYLGMEIFASASSWEVMASYDKPLVAHIAYSASDITAALALDVQAVMCSDIQDALPLPGYPTGGGDTSQLESDVQDLQSDVSGLSSTVTSLGNTVSGLSGSVSTAQSDISTLQGDVSTAQSDISTLQSGLAGKQDALRVYQRLPLYVYRSAVTTFNGGSGTSVYAQSVGNIPNTGDTVVFLGNTLELQESPAPTSASCVLTILEVTRTYLRCYVNNGWSQARTGVITCVCTTLEAINGS